MRLLWQRIGCRAQKDSDIGQFVVWTIGNSLFETEVTQIVWRKCRPVSTENKHKQKHDVVFYGPGYSDHTCTEIAQESLEGD